MSATPPPAGTDGPAADPVDELWVVLNDSTGTGTGRRWRIVGNAHTHRGHFGVVAIGTAGVRTVNPGDVAECSVAARRWLDGFLAGQEATLWEFMGADEALFDAANADDEHRWDAWNTRFRRRGHAAPLDVVPPSDPTLDSCSEPAPWVHVGGQFRVRVDDRWAVAEPQPQPGDDADGGAFWPGTPCARRRHCNPAVTGRLLICDDCHHVLGEHG